MVKIGTNEFITPVMALSSLVCAIANRKEGMRLPKNPAASRGIMVFLGTFFKRKIANGIKQIEADTIRNEPTSCGDIASNPFLIKMNELPHIRDRPISITQASTGVFCIPII